MVVDLRGVDRIPNRPGTSSPGTAAGWTAALVEARLREAAGAPAASRDPEALWWLSWLDPEDAGIVAARLDGARWKHICWRYAISRPTADRRWRYALALIAWRLNGEQTRRLPSRRQHPGSRPAHRPP